MPEPTPEKLEELRTVLMQALPILVPAAAAFLDAVQAHRDGDADALASSTKTCADSLVEASLAANKAGLLD